MREEPTYTCVMMKPINCDIDTKYLMREEPTYVCDEAHKLWHMYRYSKGKSGCVYYTVTLRN